MFKINHKNFEIEHKNERRSIFTEREREGKKLSASGAHKDQASTLSQVLSSAMNLHKI